MLTVFIRIFLICQIVAGGGTSRIALSVMDKTKEIKDIINGIDYSILDEFVRIMKKVNIFIWCSKSQMLDLMNYFKEYNFEILVWCKTNPLPQTNHVWLSDIEYCLYFREKGVKLNDGFYLKWKYYISGINQADKKVYNHPTIKPIEFVRNNILHVTQENDLVLDCFCGSGTTCVACKQTNRRYLGFEINKKYYEISKKRLNDTKRITFLNDNKVNENEEKVNKYETNLFDSLL